MPNWKNTIEEEDKRSEKGRIFTKIEEFHSGTEAKNERQEKKSCLSLGVFL